MKDLQELKSVLQAELRWNKSRIELIGMFIIALLKVKTVNLTQIALGLNPKAASNSNYRRLQRFFANFILDYDALAKFLLTLLPLKGGYVLTLDRTNWQLGKKNINILVLAIAYKGAAFPILWSLLDKKGSSNTQERIHLMDRFIDLFGSSAICCLVADREFIGKDWIAYLKGRQIKFYIRIRRNSRIWNRNKTCRIDSCFSDLRIKEYRPLLKKKKIYNHRLSVCGMKLKDDCLIIITNYLPEKALFYYKQRWEIETLFSSLKSRGFNFEDTHLTAPERINKLMGLLAIVFCWTYRVGEWQHQIKPIKVKKHKRRAKSIFRYGLDYLRESLLNIQFRIDQFLKALEFLSCT